jgi:5-methyltetrahydrofolate--homocysteine methyltransferase
VSAARRAAPDVPVVATMTFEATPRGFRTMMGVSVDQAVQALTEAGAVVLGSNCGTGIDAMIAVTREFRGHAALPLLVRANAGLPEISAGAVRYPESPEFFADRVPALVAAGAQIVGGCCGTTPRHVAAIRGAVAALSGAR